MCCADECFIEKKDSSEALADACLHLKDLNTNTFWQIKINPQSSRFIQENLCEIFPELIEHRHD
jgi:hypothetical protein